MRTHTWKDLKARRFSEEKVKEIRRAAERELLELNLRAVRDAAGKTQVEVANLAGMAQSEVSKAERRNDALLSTIRRYVEACGGELEVTAVIGGKRVRLVGV